jgi:hypothetical protein
MNAETMSAFLRQVSQAHPVDLIVMVVDGASSHRANDLVVPEDVRLVSWPPYAPEMNPQEHSWDDERYKESQDRMLLAVDETNCQLYQGMMGSAADRQRLRTLTAWPRMVGFYLREGLKCSATS